MRFLAGGSAGVIANFRRGQQARERLSPDRGGPGDLDDCNSRVWACARVLDPYSLPHACGRGRGLFCGAGIALHR